MAEQKNLIMSDFPELRLLDEVQDLSTSSDFFAFTRDQFNRAWEDESWSSSSCNSNSDDEQQRTATTGLWQSPDRGQQQLPAERSLWDPMLWDGVKTASIATDVEFFDGLLCGKMLPLAEEMAEEQQDSHVYSDLMWEPMDGTVGSNSNSTDAKFDLRDRNLFSNSNLDVETCVEGSNRLSLKKPVRGNCATAGGQPSPRTLISRTFPHKKPNRRRNGGRKNINRKTKLYEMPQFRDASRERCRLNAINSKINRDRKKNMLSEAEVAITALKTMNRKLAREAVSGRQRLLAALQEIQLLKKQLALDE